MKKIVNLTNRSFFVILILGILISGIAFAAESEVWTCAMHPQIRMPNPGKCPLCSMGLIKANKNKHVGSVKAGPNATVLSPEAVKLSEIVTSEVVNANATKTIRLVGTLKFDDTRVKTVATWIPGRITRLFINFIGMPIRKGDHLAELYSPKLITAKEELKQAKGSKQMLEAVTKKLLRWGLPQKSIEQMIESPETIENMTIYAPIGGVVIHKQVNEGDYVKEGQPVFKIGDLTSLWLVIEAYEKDLPWLRYGQKVNFNVVSFPGKDFTGVVSFIDPIVNEKNRTINIRINVKNNKMLLKPGMFAHAMLKIPVSADGQPGAGSLVGKWICPMHPEVVKDEAEQCDVCGMALVSAKELGYENIAITKPLTIPNSAALWTGARSIVYKELGPSTYDMKEVVLGPVLDDRVIVLSGLKAGDRVVSHGAFFIDAERQIQAKPSMMNPNATAGNSPKMGHANMPGMKMDNTDQDDMKSMGTEAKFDIQFIRQQKKFIKISMDLSKAFSEDDMVLIKKVAASADAELVKIDTSKLDQAQLKEWNEIAAEVRGGLKHIGMSKDIKMARFGLRHFTGGLNTLLSKMGQASAESVEKMFCPMAFNNQGAIWFQYGKKVSNPYYGQAMLRCGSEKSVIEPLKN